MKKLMLAIMLLIAASSMVTAQESIIGIFSNADATDLFCQADLATYAPVLVHVVAILDPAIPVITACEFRIDNCPVDAVYPVGQVTQTWDTNLIIGTVDWGLALAFTAPVPGPVAHLGTLEFLQYEDGWIGVDHLMTVTATNDSGVLAVVDGDYNTITVDGGMFTFNCSSGACLCEEGIPTDDTNWGAVKALY